MDKHIAFITFETPYAPGGGIAAVMAHLPQAIQSVSKVPTFVITPFHFKLEKTTRLEPEMHSIATLKINFNSLLIKVDVKIFYDVVSWVFLKPQIHKSLSDPFFAGERHPYDISSVNSDGESNLLRDSLFFGKAASAALTKICRDCTWTVLLQDWEAASCVLYLAQNSPKKSIQPSYLTLHNTYDSGISRTLLAEAGLDKLPYKGNTVIETALPLVQDPVFTVSDQFALDLSDEIFQSKIMIPHIVEQIESRLYGINNGPFINRQIPEEVFQAGLGGDMGPLSEWKKIKRLQAIKIIDEFSPTLDEPIWGDTNKFTHADLPWFVMAGRDDTRQKGFELACLAIDKFLMQDGQACFIFFPIPGDEGLKGIKFIEELTEKYPSRVLCFPFLFREGYFPIMQGASYGLMPSYYEPFGMANEYFLNGLSCIGRATGGIIQQIVPYLDAPSFNLAVSSRSVRWHPPNSNPTGFLFREKDGIKSALHDWKAINAAEYSTNQTGSNRLEEREKLILVNEIINEMSTCINDAVAFFESDREKYFELIINGAQYISEKFSWEMTAQKYIEKLSI
ncbi:MAG: glycogen/starch synthase [Anaerolineales bacterium]|nr:glycogen/starch synthase [Anaerolineales bacterium]